VARGTLDCGGKRKRQAAFARRMHLRTSAGLDRRARIAKAGSRLRLPPQAKTELARSNPRDAARRTGRREGACRTRVGLLETGVTTVRIEGAKAEKVSMPFIIACHFYKLVSAGASPSPEGVCGCNMHILTVSCPC
jgi:hypothetical protein